MMGCLNGKLDKENEDEKSRREANKKIEKQLQKDKQMYRATHRLLLLGNFLVCCVWLCKQFGQPVPIPPLVALQASRYD